MLDCSILNEELKSGKRENFLYSRVSTKKQMDNLSRQIEYISRSEFSGYTLISDIGSGINFKRKGLSTLLDSCIQGTIREIVIADRGRLSRFGFELIETIVKKGGGKITVIDNDSNTIDESKELADDLLAINYVVFNCRQMGRRSYKVKKTNSENNEDKNVSNPTPEKITQ